MKDKYKFNLFECISYIHEYTKGTLEVYDPEEANLKIYVEFLKNRLAEWDEPSNRYEKDLKSLIESVLCEYEDYIKIDKTAIIQHVATDMGTGAAFCSNCDKNLDSFLQKKSKLIDLLYNKKISWEEFCNLHVNNCERCGARFIGEKF